MAPVNVVNANLVLHASRVAPLLPRGTSSALTFVAVYIFLASAQYANRRAKAVVIGGACTVSLDEVFQLPEGWDGANIARRYTRRTSSFSLRRAARALARQARCGYALS